MRIPLGTEIFPCTSAVVDGKNVPLRDAVSALLHLGYKQAEASSAVIRVVSELGDQVRVEEAIRQSLKELT